jgi:EpsD family peptidyl-prolyl cis-trans isomerase
MTLSPSRLTLILGAVLLLTACGGDKGDKASQTAAKVNKEEITVHQINFVLERQQGVRPDQAEAVGRQILERLIDQELAVQKAEEQKLDRDPRVVRQVEAAKRDILARAYAEKIGETASKPTPEDITKYYASNPALFAERRIYNLQEINIEAKPEQFEDLRAKLSAAKNLQEFLDFLKANDFKFAGNQAVRSAEQLPLASISTMAQLQDGQSIVTRSPTGMTVLLLAGSRSQPVDEARAKPSIEAFLTNQRKGELLTKHMKELRDGAKIQYVGKYAEKPADGASAVPTATPASAAIPATPAMPAASSTGGLDAEAISKGMK